MLPTQRSSESIKRSITNSSDRIEYTPEEYSILSANLRRQLGPEYISQRPGPGNSQVQYLEYHRLLNLANDVFGFNGWSSSIKEWNVDYVNNDIN